MPDLIQVQNDVFRAISLICLIVKGFALIDCAVRKPDAFGHSLTKRSWLIILILAIIAHMLFQSPLMLLNLLGTVVALVYLAQHRGSKVL